MAPLISVVLRPVDGQPLAEMHEHVIAIPRRGETIVARGEAYDVKEVTHFALSHETGATVSLLVERLGARTRG